MRHRNYFGTYNGVTVDITRAEILTAFGDLLRYYEQQEQTANIKIIKSVLTEILEKDGIKK